MLQAWQMISASALTRRHLFFMGVVVSFGGRIFLMAACTAPSSGVCQDVIVGSGRDDNNLLITCQPNFRRRFTDSRRPGV
jgi:hypothetical protein